MSFNTKVEIEFCVRKLHEALDDYDVKAAKNYAQLIRTWNNQNIEVNVEGVDNEQSV